MSSLAYSATPESNRARACRQNEPNFDLAWQHNETVFVAEVKSMTADNEEAQLRLGLGQVLRYWQRLSALGHERVVAVLVPKRQLPDLSWRELCQELGVVLLRTNELKRAPALDMPYHPRVGFHDDLGGLMGTGQADLDLLPAGHDNPARGDGKFVRTARRHRTFEIQVGLHTITAADPLAGRPIPRHRNDRSDCRLAH